MKLHHCSYINMSFLQHILASAYYSIETNLWGLSYTYASNKNVVKVVSNYFTTMKMPERWRALPRHAFFVSMNAIQGWGMGDFKTVSHKESPPPCYSISIRKKNSELLRFTWYWHIYPIIQTTVLQPAKDSIHSSPKELNPTILGSGNKNGM